MDITSVMSRPYREYVEEIDSFDAVFANAHLEEPTLVIPYIGLGLSHHPLHHGECLKFLDSRTWRSLDSRT